MTKSQTKKLLKECKIAREKADQTLREVKEIIPEGYLDAFATVMSYEVL